MSSADRHEMERIAVTARRAAGRSSVVSGQSAVVSRQSAVAGRRSSVDGRPAPAWRTTPETRAPSPQPLPAFSLAELMVAVGILGIGLLIIAAAFPVAIDQTRQGIELSTSQMVFQEAVDTLQTFVDASELDDYMGLGSQPPLAVPGLYQLSSADPQIWLLDFDQTYLDNGNPRHIFSDLRSGDPNYENCVYSADDTYGWLAAVQKIGSYPIAEGGERRFYKFWIFVVREPKGIVAGTSLKVRLGKDLGQPLGVSTKKLNFNIGATTTPPSPGVSLLGDNGQVYRIMETGGTSAMCDRVVSDGPGPLSDVANYVAYPVVNTGLVTRRAPTVALFETVIWY